MDNLKQEESSNAARDLGVSVALTIISLNVYLEESQKELVKEQLLSVWKSGFINGKINAMEKMLEHYSRNSINSN